MLWPADMPARSLVVLSGKDDLVPAELVVQHLKASVCVGSSGPVLLLRGVVMAAAAVAGREGGGMVWSLVLGRWMQRPGRFICLLENHPASRLALLLVELVPYLATVEGACWTGGACILSCKPPHTKTRLHRCLPRRLHPTHAATQAGSAPPCAPPPPPMLTQRLPVLPLRHPC